MGSYETPEHLPDKNNSKNQPQYQYGYGQPQINQPQAYYQNPAIQKPRRKFSWWQIALMIIGGIFILLIIISAIGNSGNSNTTSAAGGALLSSDNSKQSDAIISVDYKTLYKDYMDNPINADAKYKGKRLLVTGKIYRIDREIDQSPYVTFNIDDSGLQEIRMDFKKGEEPKVAELKKGQTIKVEGTCSGTLLSSSIVLDDCAISK